MSTFSIVSAQMKDLPDADRVAVELFVDRVGHRDPHVHLSEEMELASARGTVIGLLARTGHDGRLAGFGALAPLPGGWSLELVVDRLDAGGDPDVALAVEATSVVARAGGRLLRTWVTGAVGSSWTSHPAPGFTLERELLELRVPLPLDAEVLDGSTTVVLRTFHVGRDENAWLELNGRAFAGHPEQGTWDLTALRAREAQGWFDPAGFLLLEAEGRLIGACWTKVHGDADPAFGEIFVIGVDPEAHGRGLGRSLTVAGLDHLAKTGLTVGMLFVDAGNAPARGLYASLGFQVHRRRWAYVAAISPKMTGVSGP